MLAAIKAIGVGDAVNAEEHGFTVDYKLLGLDPTSGLNDLGIAAAPIVTVPGEQPNSVIVALNNQPEAILLNFMNPSGWWGTLVLRVGMQGS